MQDIYLFNGESSSNTIIDSFVNISSAVVTLGAAPIYNQTEQIQTIESVSIDGTVLIENTDYIVTNNKGINAGEYTLKIIGKGDYGGAKDVEWEIMKTNGNLTANPTNISLSNSSLTDSILVTRAGDGIVSARSSNTEIVTVSVNDTTITVNAISSGNATITISVGEGSNYYAPNDYICNVSVNIIGALNTCTPSQIQNVVQNEIAQSVWAIGDMTSEITINASNGMDTTNACAFIIGFNHNSSIEGNGVHFQFGKTTTGKDIAFVDSGYSKFGTYWYNMNNGNTNAGGWNNSKMRTSVCPTFFNALPSSWQNVISNCTKYTDNTGGGSNTASYVTATSDKIWLLSEFEVHGIRSLANSAEQNYQVQYDYYKNGNSKVKYIHNDLNYTAYWWLRSPLSTYNKNFCRVTSGGGTGAEEAGYSWGFAPGFKIA